MRIAPQNPLARWVRVQFIPKGLNAQPAEGVPAGVKSGANSAPRPMPAGARCLGRALQFSLTRVAGQQVFGQVEQVVVEGFQWRWAALEA